MRREHSTKPMLPTGLTSAAGWETASLAGVKRVACRLLVVHAVYVAAKTGSKPTMRVADQRTIDGIKKKTTPHSTAALQEASAGDLLPGILLHSRGH
jgi:hypothetical protein